MTRGDLLGDRYRLDEPIAAGGMGEVWRATDVTLNRPVALKVVRSALLADPGFDARFRAEARTMAALHHPNVVDIYDYGHSPVPGGDASYLVMALVDGQPLSARIAMTGGLPAGETLAILTQAADALHAAHEHGIVHRDVKPANLLVRPDGTVVLVDFGVARSPAVTSATTGHHVLGTALYMAPEQASGRPVSPASDIYALGAVGYHCLAGHPPFVGDAPLEVALKHVTDPPPPLPPDVPPAVSALIMRALAKDPADRFPDAAAFAAAARAASADGLVPVTRTAPVGAFPPQSDPPTLTEFEAVRQDGDRRRLAALVGVIGMVVLLAALGLLVMHGTNGSAGNAPADRPASSAPANPAPSQAPVTKRGRPTGTPTAPDASIPGTTGAPQATTAPSVIDRPTTGGPGGTGAPVTGSAGPGPGGGGPGGGPGGGGPSGGPSGSPDGGPGAGGAGPSAPAQVLGPSGAPPAASPLSGLDHGSAVPW